MKYKVSCKRQGKKYYVSDWRSHYDTDAAYDIKVTDNKRWATMVNLDEAASIAKGLRQTDKFYGVNMEQV